MRRSIMAKAISIFLIVALAYVPVTAFAYTPEGGIYTPAKSKDVLINVDAAMLDALLGCASEQELIDKLKAALIALGEEDVDNFDFNIDNYNINLLRVELDATNTREWYIYDHAQTGWTNNNSTWWIPATDGPWTGPTTRAQTSGTNFYRDFNETRFTGDHSGYMALYGIPNSRTGATIQSVVDKYGMNGLRLTWQLREHISAYSTSVPGSDSKFANMIFSGYSQGSVADFMYYPITEESFGTIEFDINRAYVNDHSLFGAGFLINTGLGADGNQKGYLMYFRFTPDSGTNAIQEVLLYRLIGNVTPDALRGNMADTGATQRLITAANVAQVGSAWTGFPRGTQSHWRLTFSGEKLTVAANNIGEDNIVSYEWTLPVNTGFYGFGPLVSYAGHACVRGTAFQFSNVLMATQLKDSFLNLKNAQFNTAPDVDRYFINLTNQVIDDAVYSNPDNYWDTVNRLRSDEVFYLTNENNTILTDGAIRAPGVPGDLLDNGQTFGETGDELIKALAKYIYEGGSFNRDFSEVPSGGSKPTAIFSLQGTEGDNPAVPLQAIEVKRIDPDNPIYISVLDTSTPGAGENVSIAEWVYTIKGPDGNVINTITFDTRPDGDDVLLEIGRDAAIGRYRVELAVKDSEGRVSETLVRTFDVRSDDVAPEISPGPTTITRNTRGEYEQAPRTFEMTDEGWGVIAYQVEYLLPGSGDAVPGTSVINVVLNDRMLYYSLSNPVTDGLPDKYDIKITAYDWAGNKTEEVYKVNTLKEKAEKALDDLRHYLTAAEIVLNSSDLAEVQELIDIAVSAVAAYTGDGWSASALAGYSNMAAAESALVSFQSVGDFLADFSATAGISLNDVSISDKAAIKAAIAAYYALTTDAQGLLLAEITALEALETKIDRMSNIISEFEYLETFTDPHNINKDTIGDLKIFISDIETDMEEYFSQFNEGNTQENIEKLDEYKFYLRVKELIAAYDEARGYLDEPNQSTLQGITINDIPGSLGSLTIEELIVMLEQAIYHDHVALSEDAQYFLEPELAYFQGLYDKTTAYRDARDAITELGELLQGINGGVDTEDAFEILTAIIGNPGLMLSSFDMVTLMIRQYEPYSAGELTDLADIDVYLSLVTAFDKYEIYLEYATEHAGVLALTASTVKFSDMNAIQDALVSYGQIMDTDVESALTPDYERLSALLEKAEELLIEFGNVLQELEGLINEIEPYQDLRLITPQNRAAIQSTVNLINENMARLGVTGGTTADVPGYGVFQSILSAVSQYDARTGYHGSISEPINDNPGIPVANTEQRAELSPPTQALPIVEQHPVTGMDSSESTQGGNGYNSPPTPNQPNNRIEQRDNETYIELDEFGMPMGEWTWDAESEMWIFELYSPLGYMPQTGIGENQTRLFVILGLSIVGITAAFWSIVDERRKQV